MIVSEIQKDVYTLGTGKTENFKFSDNAIIFNILSDSLYSNKIGSIIRELSSNARDSHIAAGKKDIPFEIHLPYTKKDSKLFSKDDDCYFSVKDYGIGLSEEEIYNLYTVYGESNKRNSNEYIGGFGIGSKSPFAYTDNFTIISIYNGKKYTFSAFISDKNIPSITKIYEEETKEENGVEIKFSVNPSDTDSFITEAKKQLSFFNPYPKINSSFCTPFDKEKEYSGNGWFFTNTKYSLQYGLYLIIGDIAYKVEQEYFSSSFFWFGDMYVSCPIGSVSLSASRESISYTQKTITFINELIEKIKREIAENIISFISTHTLYESILEYKRCPFVFKRFKEFSQIANFKDYIFVNNETLKTLERQKCDFRYSFHGKYSKKNIIPEGFKFFPEIGLKIMYFSKECRLEAIKQYLSNKNDVFVIRYNKESDIEYINNIFGNPLYTKIESLDECVSEKDKLIKYKTFSIYSDFRFSSDNTIEIKISDFLKLVETKNPFIFLFDKKDFIGDETWTEEQISFYRKYRRIYFQDSYKEAYNNAILLPKGTYAILKKYGIKTTSFKECEQQFYNYIYKNEIFSSEDIKNLQYINENVYRIFSILVTIFTKKEIEKYAKKNILFQLLNNVYHLFADKKFKYVIYGISSINFVDKQNYNEYDEYIKNEPILAYMLVSSYYTEYMKPCLCKYLNLKED